MDDPNIRTFGLLLEAHARLTRDLDRRLREDTGTTLQTLEVLLRICRDPKGWVSMSTLADTVALTSGGITRLVDRLEDEGLVARRRCPDDGRVVRLEATPLGIERLAAAVVAHRRHLAEELAARVGPADRGRLESALDSLRAGCPQT
jgi:DNA-binding MarR family transcriptional regulator